MTNAEDSVGAKRRRERAARRRKRREREGRPSTSGSGKSWLRRHVGALIISGGIAVFLVLIAGAIIAPVIRGTQPLFGEEVALEPGIHVAFLPIPDGDPIPGGPMMAVPQAANFYDGQIEDGSAIHSLEHGLLWIAYDPDLVTPDDVDVLRRAQDRFSLDLIVSPRPQNETAITALSWGRILRMDTADEDLLRDFVSRNRNRSPEPGIR